MKLNNKTSESRRVTLAEPCEMKFNMPTWILFNVVMEQQESQKTKSGK